MKLVDKTKFVLIDQEGNEVFSSKVGVEDTRGKPGPFTPWQLWVSASSIEVKLIIHFFCKVTITIIITWGD